jgi:AcrR family transcriptional regulator
MVQTTARKAGMQAADSERPSLGGRRPTARRKLIDSGYEVMGRNGFDGSTINEIIETAGVGVGSFYNHFASKEELAKAIFAERGEELGASLEQAALNSSNIAVATCYAFRRLIEMVETDKLWAAFIVQLEPVLPMLDGLLRVHARIAIGAGVERGTLNVGNIETAITSFHAVMIAIAKSMLEGAITSDEAHGASLLAMRMFAIDEGEARRLAALSMEELRAELNVSSC